MIIFLNDDQAYLSWVRFHRDGFVLDGRRRHGRHQGLLHRSTCATIRGGKHKHWTTGTRLKACSMDLSELADWARETSGAEASACEACHPGTETSENLAGASAEATRFTPLSSNVLTYTLETAIIHLSNGAAGYRLTVADIAACLRKTPAQLTQAIQRLLDAGYLTISRPLRRNGAFAENGLIRPTIAALRTLEAYASSSDGELQAEIDKLGDRAV
jgi:hypothetical protein